MCRISPKVDFAFKKLFGSEENKDLLLSLINAILSKEHQVEDLELKNPYNLADYQAGKMSILDIKARDTTGRWFNVEMQMAEDRNFDKRALYYWAKVLTEQLAQGSIYQELSKTISINILDFDFVQYSKRFHSRYGIMNIDTLQDDKLHDVLQLHYIELKKFRKKFKEINAPLERWIAFLARAGQLDKTNLPENLACDPAIVKAVMAVDRMFNEEERQVYEIRMQAMIDQESKIASAREIAREEGREEGREKGRQEGILQVARNFLDLLDDEAVAARTGLSLDTIKTLRKETNK